ncbi:hypothetical protein ACFQY7_30440 [Actinomadura luteofluorescens]|uniref:hypothetical protein n=1 Tax=Actinomadura luteofluorescens TaxID=46163 RepID=UPI00364271EE
MQRLLAEQDERDGGRDDRDGGEQAAPRGRDRPGDDLTGASFFASFFVSERAM